jgi:hypothetical protein
MELILVASEYPFGIFKLIAGGDRHWFHSMQVQLPYNHGHNLPLSLVTKFTSIWWWSVVLLMNHTLLRPVVGVLLQDRMFQPCLSSGFLRLTFYLMHCYKLVSLQFLLLLSYLCVLHVFKLTFPFEYSLSVTCDRSVVFSGYSSFLHQKNWLPQYN